MAERERLDPLIWKVAAVATLGSFLTQMDATVVNVSLSSLSRQLDSPLATIQWVISGYLLALTLTLPLSGWLVGRIGAKALYLACFAAFTVCSALCGLAWSAESLIGFRILQGMSGGLLAPMAQMMVVRASGKHMARVIGYLAVPVLLAPVFGPVAAGAILKVASWRWLFLANLPVGIVALALAYRLLPDDRAEAAPQSLDWLGLSLLSPGLVLFLYGADHAVSGAGLVTLTAALALLAAFLYAARRAGDRALIDVALFAQPSFSAAAVTQFLANGVLYAGQMLIPLFLINVCGRSPSATGWLMMPLGLGMLCTYPWMGHLTLRFGIRRLAAGGAALSLAGTALLLYTASRPLQPAMLALALIVRGVGHSTVGIPSMSAAYASVKRAALPMATTSLNIVQRLGGPALTTACALFLQWRLNQSPAAQAPLMPFAQAFALLCALHALLLAASLRLPAR
ncbi:MAG: DHA2 family efflux MFS transporter permease subunit [Paludibacterium sp.]|uniref:DHA2 family efflux MFS transporter permease subunit n=1 Tax=Paludibacterium sp. TaxID=1917523 RepID=UPI0025E65C5B|nr:DHA2 family efflux MFS transporter permease subunit [Paludibacterium sp.]MBV8048748.1 DHA2 family efflux MFS transporter permease subunit [Paludibacterium sp.]MBV8649491.1 DHA2 family efflux MFS transporter permease subunit [Paludibacterium sp.]